MTERLREFLKLVRAANWVHVPPKWASAASKAFKEGLVTRGWGGLIRVTRAGGQKLDA